MKKEEILEKIDLLGKQGYQKCSLGVDETIITPRGIYEILDLTMGLCPLCEGYLRDNPKVEETFCDHEGILLEDIEKARGLAKLVSGLSILELEEMDIIIQRG